jgi:4-hydroxy-tetrahydrodipicolinate reductase
MGQEVLSAVCRDPKLEVVAGVDTKAAKKEILLPDGSSSLPLSKDLESVLHGCHPDVLVDFTTAEATMPAVRTAVKHGVALVIGTTGLSDADQISREAFMPGVTLAIKKAAELKEAVFGLDKLLGL